MATPLGDLMSDGLATPLGGVIAAVGRGVAEAQAALDQASLAQTLALYDTEGDAGVLMLREIGYRPTFYVLPETTCEVQVSMRIGGSGGPDGSAGSAAGGSAVGMPRTARTYVTPVDAGFANRYSYVAQAAAKLTFKIVPVPPPLALDDGRPVPNVVGLQADEAAQRLASIGFAAANVNAAGKPIDAAQAAGLLVSQQDSGPLALRPIGSTVTLTLVGGIR